MRERIVHPGGRAEAGIALDSMVGRVQCCLQEPDYVDADARIEPRLHLFVRETDGIDAVLVGPDTKRPETLGHMVVDFWLDCGSDALDRIKHEHLMMHRAWTAKSSAKPAERRAPG